MVDFGTRLRKLRKSKRITLDKISQDLGMSKITICRYEYNQTDPKLSYLKDIANYFDTSVDYLVEDREDYKLNLFVRTLAAKLQRIGFDFEAMSLEEKEALADLLVLYVKQALESKSIINKIKSTD